MRKILAALALVALCASGAFSQVVIQDGNSPGGATSGKKQLGTMLVGGIRRSDTTAVMSTYDSNNNQYVVEANPAYGQVLNQLIMQTQFVHNGTNLSADSSGAVSTLGYRFLALEILPSPATSGDSIMAGQFALQVRGSDNATTDSTHTFDWTWSGRSTNVANTYNTLPDSIGSIVPGSAYYVAGNDTTAQNDELVLNVTKITMANRGLYVPIVNRDGVWFSAPYTSIRLRHIQSYMAGMVARGPLKEARWNVSIRLIGWR